MDVHPREQVYKWKKLACRALKANGGVMKTKRLQDNVLVSIGVKTEPQSALKEQMLSTVRGFILLQSKASATKHYPSQCLTSQLFLDAVVFKLAIRHR